MNLNTPLLPRFCIWGILLLTAFFGPPAQGMDSGQVDLKNAVIVVRPGPVPPAEEMAARALSEEVKSRTGLNWPITKKWPGHGVAIVVFSGPEPGDWAHLLKPRAGDNLPETRAEGFRLSIEGTRIVWIHGADSRGALFGVGQLLRSLNWGKGSASLPKGLEIATAPALPIRGHQLGYRDTANSWDAWNDVQFEQYIRELALFGANSIEGIPFQDERKSPVMTMSRDVMNRRISEICARYELDYWIWAPATFDLKDTEKREALLKQHEELYRRCPRMDGVFFPGGDPGNNSPENVFPFLEDVSKILTKYHPKAKVWLSMQGFEKPQVDYVHAWINEKLPSWLGGLVGGPSSPPIPETRARLPERYGLRDYPDITHTVRCQYPTAWWDPAFALTLGRECANPRPVFYKAVQDLLGPHTCGFIAYSDGVHDDVNKTVWSRLAWEPDAQPRAMVLEYARCFFGAEVAEAAADGILALEKNWEGPLADNGSVDAVLSLWQALERKAPGLRGNWRWQLCLLRAHYDTFTRHRQIRELELERAANQALATAPAVGADAAMAAASNVLEQAISQPVRPELRARIVELCADLWRSISLQTSVKLYHAAGPERGALLDFIDYPLNNRWWLQDEFARIRKMPTEAEKLVAIDRLARWESPGPGSFYDEVGNIARSPHVVRGEGVNTDPIMERNPNPTYWWWDNGSSRRRLSWQTSMDWPLALAYGHLDSRASYRIRLTGFGQALIRANGQLLTATVSGREVGEFKEFEVPPALVKDGKLRLTFDPPTGETGLNWRDQSRLSEVWLLKQ